jgi:hypothetical protein
VNRWTVATLLYAKLSLVVMAAVIVRVPAHFSLPNACRVRHGSTAAHFGATTEAELARVGAQAGSDAGAIGNVLVAQAVSVGLARILLSTSRCDSAEHCSDENKTCER